MSADTIQSRRDWLLSERPARLFDGYTVHRLRRLKRHVDAHGRFSGRAS